VSEWVSLSHQNELNALQVAIFHRSSPNLPSWWRPRRCDHLITVLVDIRNTEVRQTGSGINFLQLHLWKNTFNVKYIENGESREICLCNYLALCYGLRGRPMQKKDIPDWKAQGTLSWQSNLDINRQNLIKMAVTSVVCDISMQSLVLR